MATIHVNRAGTNLGTFSEEEVRAGLRAARFLGTDLGWREGMPAWQPLSQFTEFAADLAAAVAPPPETPRAEIPLPPAAAAAMPAPIAPAPAAPPTQLVTPRSGLPWDRRVELGLFKAFIETLQMILARPTTAFTAMKREGGLWEPLLYALIGGTFGTVVNFIYRFGLQAVTGDTFGSWNEHRMFGSIGILFLIIFSPLLVIIGTFLAAGVIHLCLLMVGGARQPFETTFRVVCFTTGSVNPLQVVPFCGSLIAGVWALVLYCIGLARAHETDTGRAVLAVFLPLVICCGGLFLLVVLVGGIGALSHSWH
jgi:hypothetical protein